MLNSFWKEPGHHTVRGWWWVRAISEEITSKCAKFYRIWPAYQLEQDECTFCTTHSHKKCKTIRSKRQVDAPNLRQTLGLVMCTVLPEEIEKFLTTTFSRHELALHSALSRKKCYRTWGLLMVPRTVPQLSPQSFIYGSPAQILATLRRMTTLIDLSISWLPRFCRTTSLALEIWTMMTTKWDTSMCQASTTRGPWPRTCWTLGTCQSPHPALTPPEYCTSTQLGQQGKVLDPTYRPRPDIT